MARLGDILIEHGAIDRATVEAAYRAGRGQIGAFLHAHHLITARQLAKAVAAQHGLPYIELTDRPPARELFQQLHVPHYLRYRYVPLAREGNDLTIATTHPSDALLRDVAHRTGLRVRMVVTSPRDLSLILNDYGGLATTRIATHQLRRRHKHLSASRTMERPQIYGFGILAAILLGSFLWDMQTSWNILLMGCNLFYFTSLAFKLQLYSQGMIGAKQLRRLDKKLTTEMYAIADEALPVYSILVPMYGESADVMGRLIGHLDALDYPKEKLDIKLIIEADDVATEHALLALQPPPTMQIVRVPPSQPRTKPKACNVALQDVRGEFLVIYDAEDAPAPDQLRKAVALFRSEREDLACLQAPLNYYNRNENMLTRLFALEYSTLFRILLPAMERMQLPIPLGGTSNHLRVATLLACGGWDAFNVTEDADLGIRLSYFGHRTRLLPSITLEEAPIGLRAWMKQRTRWIKGYIQTWLVYMRDPATLKRRFGARSYYGFQFFVGAPALTFLLAPLLWGVFIIAPLGLLPTKLSPFMLTLCGISFVGGVAINWLFAQAVLRLERWHEPGMAHASMVFPFYWLLHSVACARALWQLARAPHYWEKTTHGVSQLWRKQAAPTA